MAGLYNKKNLGEVQLNLKDAVQKLYNPGIEKDLRLFAFSNSLYSEISSAVVQADATEVLKEIYGLINVPFTKENGVVVNRTKFVTNKLTYSSNNKVFFNTISSSGLTFDKRTDFTEGAPVVVSRNGSLVNAEVIGAGSQYEIITPQDAVLTGASNAIRVNVRGKESGAENAIAEITILANGTVSTLTPPSIIFGGSGYLEEEELAIITQCRVNRFGQQETPALQKCKNYPSTENRLFHKSFKYTVPQPGQNINYNTATLGYEAVLAQSKYLYKTADCDEGGFFLFDERTAKWLYLGDFYNNIFVVQSSVSPLITIRRYDTITSLNLLNLESLNATSYLFDYYRGFSVGEGLGAQIRSLSQSVETVKGSFKDLLQNNKRQRRVTDEKNTLGTSYNIFDGRNFNSSFRLIMRDPDGVIDKDQVAFTDIRSLEQPDQVELTIPSLNASYHIPGMYINVGGVYKRAFSTDDKPFLSSRGNNFISPLIDKLTNTADPYTTGGFVSRTSSGENKYSISTAYLRPGGEVVVGFDTNIGSLVQNLSSVAGNGGFVYRRVLITPDINTSQNVKGWPLLDYVHLGIVRSPVILAYSG